MFIVAFQNLITEGNLSETNLTTATVDGLELGDDGIISATSPFGRALAITAPMVSMLVMLSPCLTMRRIIQEKSVEDLSPIPYLCLLLTAIAWALYGIVAEDYSVAVPYTFGTIISSLFLAVYLLQTPRVRRKKIYFYYLCLTLLFVVAGYICYAYWEDPEQRLEMLGYLALASYFAFLTSPVGVVLHVFRTKQIDCLPFELCFFVFFECLLWLLYAVLVANDSILAVAAGSGLLFTALQLFCHVLYGDILLSLQKIFCFFKFRASSNQK